MKSKETEPSSSITMLKFSKRSKDDNLAAQSENIITDGQAPEKPKKRKAKGSDHPEQQHDNSHKKRNKRKKGEAEKQEESLEHKAQSEEAEGESEPPKKKHKNRTIFSDPREDTQLNAQSRKGAYHNVAIARLEGISRLSSTALEYVFTQMNRPSRWKFNKARQNWLIRNVWSSETVSRTFLCF